MTREWVIRVAVLAVGGVCLYILAPSLAAVYGSLDDVTRLKPWWLITIVACEAAMFVCVWELFRLALRTDDWFTVATSQLASNAATLASPGGPAAGAALQLRMLQQAGIDTTAAVSSLGAASLLATATIFATPLLALPVVIAGVPVADQLRNAIWLGLIVFALLATVGVVLLTTTRPVVWIGHTVQRIRNRMLRHHAPITDLADRLLDERRQIRDTLGRKWRRAVAAAIGKVGFDYLALLAALAAVGAKPSPALVLVAFAAAEVMGMIPLTPGGIGFVEFGLTGALTLAGVDGSQALIATAAYRLGSFWLSLPAGLVAWLLFRRRVARAAR